MSKQNTAALIVEALHVGGKMTTEQLALRLNLSASAIQKNAKTLIEAGKVIRVAKGIYELPAPKQAKASKAKTPRGESLSSFIRASLIDQGDDRKLVLAAAKAKFPNLKPTMGLVNWIAKKMGEQREEFQA